MFVKFIESSVYSDLQAFVNQKPIVGYRTADDGVQIGTRSTVPVLLQEQVGLDRSSIK